MSTRRSRTNRGRHVARATAACGVALTLAIGVPVGAATAAPDRGPHKSTPGGTNNDNHVRRGAEPDRSPHKSVPGHVSTAPRAQTNRGRADFTRKPQTSSQSTGSPSTRATPGLGSARTGTGTGTGESSGRPQSRPAAPQQPATQPPAPQQASPQPASPPPAPVQQVPQPEPAAPQQSAPTLPQRPTAPTVDVRSVGGTPDLPGSVVMPGSTPSMSVPNRTGTERVFDIAPGQNGPFAGGDPRTTRRTIDPDANDGATGKLSGDLIDPNPITEDGAEVPAPEERETTRTYRGGSVTKPGKGEGLEIGVGDRYQLRVVGAVPDGTRTVVTPYGPETAVKYRYQYQSRRWVTPSLGGGALFNYVGKWEDASPDRVDQLVKRGVPLPGVK